MRILSIRRDKNLKINKKCFDALLKISSKEEDINEKIKLFEIAAGFAVYNHTGLFSSDKLENYLLDIAEDRELNLKDKFNTNTVLHVMTDCNILGGHTVVVNNWIEFSNKMQKHDVILLDNLNKNTIPSWLVNTVKGRGGKIINLSSEKKYLEKSLKFRELASKYEYVILHVHMYDVLPVLAFGNKEFRRPVLFFNHADHIFNVGVSISDMFLDIRKSGRELTLKRRGVKKSSFLPIPLNKNDIIYKEKISKEKTRKKLGLPIDKIIFLSIGSEHKYKPFGKYNFIKEIKKILKEDKNSICVVIGPSEKSKYWKKEYYKSKKKIIPLGIVNKQKLKEYIKCCDLYIDSFPINGATTLLEVAVNRVPFITVKTGIRHLDVFSEVETNIKDLHKKVIDSINNKKIPINIAKNIEKTHFKKHWSIMLSDIINKIGNNHTVNRKIYSVYNNDNYDIDLLRQGNINNCVILMHKFKNIKQNNMIKIYKLLDKYDRFLNRHEKKHMKRLIKNK